MTEPKSSTLEEAAKRGITRPNGDSTTRELEHRLVKPVLDKTEIVRLPAMPVVVDRALEASRSGDPQALGKWIALDPILVLRLLDARARQGVAQSIDLDQCLKELEPEVVKAGLIGAARAWLGRERTPLLPAELGGHWVHSLHCAFLCRALAKACGYRKSQEAYVAGLLHDVGSVALLSAVPETFRSLAGGQVAEPAQGIVEHAGRLGTIHAQVGAALVERLGLPFFIADALLLHHAPTRELEGTHLLVRIVRVAETLSHSGAPAQQLEAMAALLGVSAKEAADAEMSAGREVAAVLDSCGLSGLTNGKATRDPSEPAPSVVDLQHLTETLVLRFVKEAKPGGVASQSAKPAEARAREERTWSDVLYVTNAVVGSIVDEIVTRATRLEAQTLLEGARDEKGALAKLLPILGATVGLSRAVVFLPDEARKAWTGWIVDQAGARDLEFGFMTQNAQSVVALAAREVRMAVSYGGSAAKRLAGFDLEIARILNSDGIVAFPLRDAGKVCRGVAVFGSSGPNVQSAPLLGELVDLVARATWGPERTRTQQPSADAAEQLRSATRRLVHEARNPLTVLKTYLELARRRAASGEALGKELEIAEQELGRVARLLEDIGKPQVQSAARSAPVQINGTIEDLLMVYGGALFTQKGIALTRELDEGLAPLTCEEEGLKQVLLNLLKNASEATDAGGSVSVRSADQVNWEGRMMVEICVSDTGRGMSAQQVASLFTGTTMEAEAPESEGAEPGRGLGLPTSLAIVRRMNGHLVCRSRLGQGTSFCVLLPREAAGAKRDVEYSGAAAEGA